MKKRMIYFLMLLLLFGTLGAQNASDILIIQQYENSIKKSPDKSGLYDTLGMLYNAFHDEELKAGNEEKAQDYYLKAEECFLTAIQIDSLDFNANYSLGVMYYNDALAFSNELLAEEPDFSAAGKAKYALQKKKETDLWEKALPFFKNAESVYPNDIGTIYALINIFGQLGADDLLDTFKARLKVIQDGGQHDEAFFE